MRYPQTFEQWQHYARTIENRVKALEFLYHQKGWNIAKQAGIGLDMCCIHNASIDDALKGWCFQNPERLKAAKRANFILSDFHISHLGQRLIDRAWNHYIEASRQPATMKIAKAVCSHS